MATPLDNLVPLTGNSLIDGLTWGSAWQFEDASHVLTYSLSLNDNPNGGEWNQTQADTVRNALAAWSNVADITFVETGSGTVYLDSPADLSFILTGNELQTESPGVVALGLPPSPSFAEILLSAGAGSRAAYPQPEGDIALDNYNSGFSYLNTIPGGVWMTILLHEIGHALGLKHTDSTFGGRPSFGSLGIANLDSNLYTVMSYTDPSGSQIGTHLESGNAATPMPLDILAIQQIYGANTTYRTGDDTYFIDDGQGSRRVGAIWDSGGTDVLAITPSWYSNSINDLTIDLREGSISRKGESAVSIAYGTTIENALGSATNDNLIGNTAGNRLEGAAGNDRLNGGAGDDFLDGGSGNDIARYAGVMGGFAIGLDSDGKCFIVDTDTAVLDEGHDTAVSVEQLGFADGTISLALNQDVQVNTYVARDQTNSHVVALSNGGYVVAWTSWGQDQDGSGTGVYLQVFDAIGNRIGGEIRANSYVTDYQNVPSIAALGDGGFVVAWQSLWQDGYEYGIYFQRFDGSGVPIGGETLASMAPNASQSSPSVAALVDGGFAIAWQSYGQGGVFVRRFEENGQPGTGEVQVDTFSGGGQGEARVVALKSGDYVVVWTSSYQDYIYGGGIYQQRFDAHDNKLGGETRVNTSTAPDQAHSSVAALEDGGYVIVWQAFMEGIYSQRYDAQGNAIGAESLVDEVISGMQIYPTVVGLIGGGYRIYWDTGTNGGRAQSFDADGNRIGGEFNTVRASDAVDQLADGTFVETGTRYVGDGRDVFMTRVETDETPTLSVLGDSSSNVLTWAGSRQAILDGGAGNDALSGALGNDTLLGGEGNDLLNGGRGADRMEGGTGNDLYVVDHRFDQITELADSGFDSVSAKASHALADNVENLYLTGSVTLRSGGFFSRKTTTIDLNSDGTGNASDNLLRGNRGHNQLDGLGGNDILLGGAAADVLNGGTGADRLVGGAGADVFVFAAGDGGTSLAAADMLYDFEDGIDRIALAGGLDFADLTISQDNGTDTAVSNTVIRAGSEEYLAVLLNVSPGSITAADFYTLGI